MLVVKSVKTTYLSINKKSSKSLDKSIRKIAAVAMVVKVLSMSLVLVILIKEVKSKFIRSRRLTKLKIFRSKFHKIRKLCRIWRRIYFLRIIQANSCSNRIHVASNRWIFMMSKKLKTWMILSVGLLEALPAVKWVWVVLMLKIRRTRIKEDNQIIRTQATKEVCKAAATKDPQTKTMPVTHLTKRTTATCKTIHTTTETTIKHKTTGEARSHLLIRTPLCRTKCT